MKIAKRNLLAAVVAVSALVAPARDFELVGKRSCAEIVIPANAEDSTKYAAGVLVEYVEKMTGRKLEVKVKGEGERGTPRVIIGTLATLKDVPADIAAKLKGAKQFEAGIAKATPDTLWFVGKETPGEHYAVCNFLETKCGVRWFTTKTEEDPGEYVPRKETIAVAPYESFREPLFMERRLSMVGSIWYPIPEESFKVLFRAGFQPHLSIGYPLPSQGDFWRNTNYVYFVRAHLSPHKRRVGGGHHLFDEVAPKKMFDEHPEFFPLVDGKRVWNHLHCFSNTNLLQRVVDVTLKKYGETGGDGQFLFGMADMTRGWCECEACRKLDDPNSSAAKAGIPDISTRFSKAVNYMAPQIYAKYPDAEIVRWAYTSYRDLPTGVTHDPRMYFQYCSHGRCHGHALDDPNCRRNKAFRKQLGEWRAFSGKGGFLYDYYCGNSEENYTCCEHKEQEDIRLYKKLGMVGWKNEMQYTGSTFVKWVRKDPVRKSYADDVQASNWRYYYVVGRLLWDDSLDVDAMLDEVDTLFYGPAAKPMCAYQRLRRKLWESSPVCMGYPWGNPRSPQLLNDLGAKEQLFKYLDEAERLVEEVKVKGQGEQRNCAIYKHRIADDRRWLERYWVKPNDKFRSKMGSAFKAPRPTGPIVIDGKGDERDWAQAYYTDAFFKNTDGEAHPAIPSALKTSVGILADDKNFYFLVTAREPHPEKLEYADGVKRRAWSGDRMEFFFYPPSIENTYFQVAVNVSGANCFRVYPAAEDLKSEVETKTVVGKDSWTMEVKVPVRRMYDLIPGETWRIHFCRGRGFGDEVSPKASWTIDGTGYHQPTEYHQIEIGEAYLTNGSFEDVDEKGHLKGWCGDAILKPGRYEQVKHADGSGVALKLGTIISQEVTKGPFNVSDRPRTFKYSFRAKGPGTLNVFFFRFTNIPKRHIVEPHGAGGTYKLTDEWKTYTGEYTIAANEWIFFVMRPTDCPVLIDDVQLTPIE